MGYLVLARKWRPQAFEDLTGQGHVVRTLANAIAQGRVAHALLLCGPRGVGKTTTARLLARALNCESGPTAEPCGSCRPCQEIAAGTSVDVVEIDGASNNGVENVREIRETVRYLPQRDRHKIYIIDEVHMLSVAAFNALLKTLEEPPAHVKFIFATTDPQRLPDTILSRCQRHNFKRVSAEEMVQRLRTICGEEGISISDRVLGQIARQADGGMRDALSLLDQLIATVGLEIDDEAAREALGLVDRTLVFSMGEALLSRDGAKAIELVDRLYERGLDAKAFCEELAEHLRDLLYVQAVGRVPEGLSDLEAQALQTQAQAADGAQLARLFQLVHGAIRELSFAARPRLALEVALLSAVHLAPGQGLAQLAARLESLAGGGGGQQGGAPPRGDATGGGGGAMPGRSAPQGAPPPRQEPYRAGQRQGGGALPKSTDDLLQHVQAMAQAAPRQQRSRPRPSAGGESQDGEPDGGRRSEPPTPAFSPPVAPPTTRAPTPPSFAATPPPAAQAPTPPPSAPLGSPQPEPQARPPMTPSPRAGAAGAPPPEMRTSARPPMAEAPVPAGAPPPWGDDDVPPPDDGDLPPSYDEAPTRLFAPEAPPEGCASSDCTVEGEPKDAAAVAELGPGDDPTLPMAERWRRLLQALQERSPVVYSLLAEGRLAWIRPGELALGFDAERSFHRAQLEGGELRARAEEILSRWFGGQTRLRLDVAAPDAPASVAEESRSERRAREEALREEARSHPAVRSVQTVLGATIAEIRILEER